MKLVLTLLAGNDPEVVDAQLAYHLNAGVDFVVASADAATETLRRYEREGNVRLLEGRGEPDARTLMARLAATEHGADWVINADAGEFWWPRAETLKEVLAPIPPRYTIVQGLRREFFAAPGEGELAERMTLRRSLEHGTGAGETPGSLLRPAFRADPSVVVHSGGAVELSRNVPLRAWYPLEVLHLAVDSAEEAPSRADLGLVDDTRLRDALRSRQGGSRISFRAPDIVDDARYAVECAAVGEVDLPRLEQYVTELEERIAWLEQRFWPRVLRKLSSLVRR